MPHVHANTAGQPYHLAVGALVLHRGRLLVLERADGTLVLPTGTLREDEGLLSALRRELLE